MKKYSELTKEEQDNVLVYLERHMDYDGLYEIKSGLFSGKLCCECFEEKCKCDEKDTSFYGSPNNKGDGIMQQVSTSEPTEQLTATKLTDFILSFTKESIASRKKGDCIGATGESGAEQWIESLVEKGMPLEEAKKHIRYDESTGLYSIIL